MKDKLIIIVGPTCSGKSDIAIDLAKRMNGSIISADSMQIYREMDIATAKTRKEDYQGIPHYMLDIIYPNEEFSVAVYKEHAEQAIDEVIRADRKPIIVGGTGLYINSLIYPMSFGKADKNEDMRLQLNNELALYGAEYIHNKLRLVDPLSADRLHPNNTRRVIRAIEIASICPNDREEMYEPIRDYIMIGLNIDRDILYDRINRRVDMMFQSNLLNEIEYIKEKYTLNIQATQAIGYKEFREFYEGIITIEQVVELIKKNTRNYAKRQMTWFKRYKDIQWFNPLTEYEQAIDYVMRNL